MSKAYQDMEGKAQAQQQHYQSMLQDLEQELAITRALAATAAHTYTGHLTDQTDRVTTLTHKITQLTHHFDLGLRDVFAGISQRLEGVGADWKGMSAIRLSEASRRKLADFTIARQDVELNGGHPARV